MKTEFKKAALSLLKKAAYQTAEKNANTACPTWTYQTKQPEKVNNLRKF